MKILKAELATGFININTNNKILKPVLTGFFYSKMSIIPPSKRGEIFTKLNLPKTMG